MDATTVIQALTGVIMFMAGWIMKNIWAELKELRGRVHTLENRSTAHGMALHLKGIIPHHED